MKYVQEYSLSIQLIFERNKKDLMGTPFILCIWRNVFLWNQGFLNMPYFFKTVWCNILPEYSCPSFQLLFKLLTAKVLKCLKYIAVFFIDLINDLL